MPTVIDTRKAFRRLQEQGGFSDEQADAIVDIFTDVDEQVATRGDIDRLEDRIEATEDHLRQHTENMVSAAEDRLKASMLVHVYTAAGIVSVVILLTRFLS
jgi:hypothetical protein